MQLLSENFLILRKIEEHVINNVYYNCAVLGYYGASHGSFLITIGGSSHLLHGGSLKSLKNMF